MVQDLDLVLGVDLAAHDAELTEDLEVLLLLEDIVHLGVDHLRRQVLDQPISHEVVHNELVILQQLLHQTQERLGLLDKIPLRVILIILRVLHADNPLDHISQDKHNPLANVNLEHLVVADQFCDDLVNGVVQFDEFLLLVVFLAEY